MEFLELDGGVVGTAAAAAAAAAAGGGEGEGEGEGGTEEREVSLEFPSGGSKWRLGLLTVVQCGDYEWEEDEVDWFERVDADILQATMGGLLIDWEEISLL